MTLKEFEIQYALGSLSYKMKVKLTCAPNTPIEILTMLSKDKNRDIRFWVAANPSTPIEVLKKLSTDKERHIRVNVAYNSNTSAEILVEVVKNLKKELGYT